MKKVKMSRTIRAGVVIGGVIFLSRLGFLDFLTLNTVIFTMYGLVVVLIGAVILDIRDVLKGMKSSEPSKWHESMRGDLEEMEKSELEEQAKEGKANGKEETP